MKDNVRNKRKSSVGKLKVWIVQNNAGNKLAQKVGNKCNRKSSVGK